MQSTARIKKGRPVTPTTRSAMANQQSKSKQPGDLPLKTCPKCHTEYPATNEFFCKDKRNRDGFFWWCRVCVRKATDCWHKDHPEKVRESNSRWRTANPEAEKAQKKVRRAIRSGRLKVSSVCERCGNGGMLHKHHADYSKPLNVIVLCPRCHRYLHLEDSVSMSGSSIEDGGLYEAAKRGVHSQPPTPRTRG